MPLIDRAEARRKSALATLDAEEQASLGQYFTPYQAAIILADLPRIPNEQIIRVLDPGAGSGMLTAALVDRIRTERPEVSLEVVAVEVDEALRPALNETLTDIEALGNVKTQIIGGDFLAWALSTNDRFDMVIQNPPYAKLNSMNSQQKMLRSANIEVPNIYAAFLALGIRLLKNGGQQVAITPRSWMNGTYYSRFRREFVEMVGIDAIHTFESRSKVFGDTGVLQEAVVVSVTRGRRPKTVKLFTSQDHRDHASIRVVEYNNVVTEDFIHIPATEKDGEAVAWITKFAQHTLSDLELSVSTGRVIDFRSREMLFHDRINGAWPMVHSSHIFDGATKHPVGAKKPEWFHADQVLASKILAPAGTYVLIKRFSSKEERRRVSAGVWHSEDKVAFDNKLNFVHHNGEGLDHSVAIGLAMFLNSTRLDNYFRVFSGHTQVNATDLRQMRFPSWEQLQAIASLGATTQDEIDYAVENILTASGDSN